MRFSNLAVAVISLFASSTLLAQSAPPKQSSKPAGTTVAQSGTPAPAGGSAQGVPASSEGDEPGSMSTGTKALIGIGIAAGIAAAASGGGGGGGSTSTTTHH
jgi:hypothetical protein